MKKIKSLLSFLTLGAFVLGGCSLQDVKAFVKDNIVTPAKNLINPEQKPEEKKDNAEKPADEQKPSGGEQGGNEQGGGEQQQHTHTYGEVQVSWVDNVATARVECTADDCDEVVTETKEGHFVEDTPATCEEAQRGHYEVTFDNALLGSARTAANSVEGAAALGHEYGQVEVVWNGMEATATRVCSHDSNHTVSETKEGHFVEDTPATCEEPQKGHYEVTFEDAQFGSAATAANSVVGSAALGHDYGAVQVSWNGMEATAQRVCSHDPNHVVSETKEGHFVEDTPATCTEPQKGHYEVTFEDSQFGSAATAANSVVGSAALGHDYGAVQVSWNGMEATATKVCSHDANHVVTETKEGHFVEDTAATCTEPQKGHYEVAFDNTELGSAATAANSVVGAAALGHDYQPSVSASSAIGYKALACSRCGELNGLSNELMALADIDFNVNKFGAAGGKWGAEVLSALVLAHEISADGAEDEVFLPKINFKNYKVVTFNVAGRADWDTQVGLTSGDYAFPYAYVAYAYSGELSFITSGDTVTARLSCGSTLKTLTITDADIVNGEKSASLFMRADHAYRGIKVELTGLYESCPHNFAPDLTKIGSKTCSICGEESDVPMTVDDINFTTNSYGAKLMNGTTDVSTWGSGYNGGNKFNAYSPTSLSYAYYGWGLFDMHLPRIDFTKYAEVSFTLGNTQVNADAATGNAAGFRIGFESGSVQNFASTWENCELSHGKLTFTYSSGKVIAKISSFGFLTNYSYEITDAEVINGTKSVVLYAGSYLNESTSYAILLSNPTFVFGVDAQNVNDASIKEIQLNKQVRRVEQQDEWKSPIGSASNESGHADYYNYNGRDAIHFSAHYEDTDPEFGYNSGWSEWRFVHEQAGLTSVTFTYLYEDSNSDVDSDGGGTVHTMAQWYDNNKTISSNGYVAVGMDLVSDGQWHTITVEAASPVAITHFVMKIFHFTGDIYISNLIYSTNETDVNDASIKEIQLNKQVRRVEQQDEWKSPIGSASNESGHADYVKAGSRDAIHFSAHYASTDPEFTYNSGWSEWRFAHATAGLTSVTFDYCYSDSNSDTSNDGNGDIHTMAQWYGAAYQARDMVLINDGLWHTITVTGEAYDTNCFVMKIFHFTGDIYISNLSYQA